MGWASEHQIEMSERGYEDLDATICLDHIVDDFLLAAAGAPTATSCTFCDRAENYTFAADLQVIMPVFMDAFWSYYGRLDSAAVFDGEYVGVTDTPDAVWDVASGAFADEVSDNVLDAIIGSIVDTEVSRWFNYMGTDDLEFGWTAFSEIAKHVSRFVVPSDRDSRSPMARVIGFLDELTVYVDGALGLIRPVPPGTSIYRGRLVADAHGDLPATAELLGPAPKEHASSNRMSPAGVPMFYGSEDGETAVAEIAFHGIQPWAVIGEFVSQEELQVLDLTEIPELISPFDAARRGEARMRDFLTEFVAEMTRPVVPDGRQHIEHAPSFLPPQRFVRQPVSSSTQALRGSPSENWAPRGSVHKLISNRVPMLSLRSPGEYMLNQSGESESSATSVTVRFRNG